MISTFKFNGETYPFRMTYRGQVEFESKTGRAVHNLGGASMNDLAHLFFIGFEQGAKKLNQQNKFGTFEQFEEFLDDNFEDAFKDMLSMVVSYLKKGMEEEEKVEPKKEEPGA